MKQHTTKEQTQHLIELGFPRPESISEVNYYDEAYTTETEFEYDYSIGELIEFLPKELKYSGKLCVDYIGNLWQITYDQDFEREINQDEELIDALYDACVELKKEGVIQS